MSEYVWLQEFQDWLVWLNGVNVITLYLVILLVGLFWLLLIGWMRTR
jgi:hypothetical protein